MVPAACLTATVLAAALLGGCGGADRVSAARDGRLAITLDDYFITPQEVEAPAGRVTFVVTDRGRLGHNLRVRSQDGRDRVKVTTLLPGDSATASAKLPRGNYKMVCTVANHAELGMSGRLVVR
jgi:plastocyanin